MALGALEQAAEVEIAAGVEDVFGDLGAEVVDGGELDLGAEALEEGNLHFCVGLKGDGMEVEQMGLDGEGLILERGAETDVGDGVEDSSEDSYRLSAIGCRLFASRWDVRGYSPGIMSRV